MELLLNNNQLARACAASSAADGAQWRPFRDVVTPRLRENSRLILQKSPVKSIGHDLNKCNIASTFVWQSSPPMRLVNQCVNTF